MRILDREMSEPAEPLYRYGRAGGYVQASYAVEDCDTGAEEGCVGGGGGMGRNGDGGFVAKCAVFGV